MDAQPHFFNVSIRGLTLPASYRKQIESWTGYIRLLYLHTKNYLFSYPRLQVLVPQETSVYGDCVLS